MKFKVGDRVVVTRCANFMKGSGRDFSIGTSYVVHSFHEDDDPKFHCYYPKSGAGFFEGELEFEHVYNSPLYQALS